MAAILHGNEVCGAIALDRLLRAGIRRNCGRLTFVFANIDAYHRKEGGALSPCRFIDEDMNRARSPSLLDGNRNSHELRRARALRPIIDSADYLLDIHSMQQGTPLLLSGPLQKGRRLALDLGFPALVVCRCAATLPVRGSAITAAWRSGGLPERGFGRMRSP